MKQITHFLAGSIVALLPVLALGLPGVASATPITLDNPSASFSNPVPASGELANSNIDYVGDTNQEVRFGVPTNRPVKNPLKQQSGLRFDVFSAPLDVNIGETFNLGTLSHFNWEVKTGTSITGATLSFTFDIVGGNPETFNIPFSLGVDETTNSGRCAYGNAGDAKCPDRIVFPQMVGASTFVLDGQTLTLKLLGFGPSAGDLQNDFITQEFADNSTKLWASISAPTTQVPEPGSLLMLALGLFGLGGLLAHRQKRNGKQGM